MENLMKPFIKLDKAVCFDCMIPIRIYESEANDIELSQEGIPLNITPIQYRCFGICPKCGKRYKIERHGVGFSITSDLKQLISGGKEHEELQQEQRNYNEFGYGVPGSR